ncbi:MAG: hypothetical protein ACXADW_18840, partial [Candidatus Hodarchaeales archaeon]
METEELRPELNKNKLLESILIFAEIFLVIEASIIFTIINSEFIFVFLKSIILLFIGKVFTKWYAKKKELDDSNRKAYQINVLWLLMNIPLEFLILTFLGTSIIFDPIKVIIEIVLLSVVILRAYNLNSLKESLIFSIIVQVLLYIVAINIEIFVDSYLFTVSGDDDLFASGVMFYFCVLVLIGINGFYIKWGDKMQFVKDRNIIILITTTPALYYLTDLYFSQGRNFMPNYALNILTTLIFVIIISTVAKILASRTVNFEEFRDLTILEKGEELLEVVDLKVYYPLIGGMLKRQ